MKQTLTVAAMAALALIVVFGTRLADNPTPPRPTPTVTAVAPVAPVAPDGTDDHEPTGPPDRAWVATADRFLTAYLSNNPPARWRAQVRALSTPALSAGFALTDPARVPDGPAAPVTVVTDYDTGGGVARALLPDGTRLLVTVVTDPTGKAAVANVGPE